MPAQALDGLLRGIGQIFLLDKPLAGLLIVVGLFIAHPYAALWALIASAIGGAAALLLDQPQAAWMGVYGFNAALTALAFSRQHEPPWLTALAIGAAVSVQWASSQAPVLTLTAPFVVACWLMHVGTHLGQKRISKAFFGL